MQCRSHSRRLTSECLFVTACSMDEYAEEKRTKKNLIVRSGISEAETTNNKRLRSMFCIEAKQTRSIARPLCDSWASCFQTGMKINVLDIYARSFFRYQSFEYGTSLLQISTSDLLYIGHVSFGNVWSSNTLRWENCHGRKHCHWLQTEEWRNWIAQCARHGED